MFAVVRLADVVLMVVTVDATSKGVELIPGGGIQSGWRVTWVFSRFSRRKAK